jgi:hypothetical protein
MIVAKVNVEYDTVSKSAYVTIDGKPMDNLFSLSVYCGYDVGKDGKPKFCLEAMTIEHDEDNDIRKMNRVMAAVKEPKAPSAHENLGEYLSFLLTKNRG